MHTPSATSRLVKVAISDAEFGQELVGQRLGFGQKVTITLSEIGAGLIDQRQLIYLKITSQLIIRGLSPSTPSSVPPEPLHLPSSSRTYAPPPETPGRGRVRHKP
jgi:hypothetical protein